MFYSAQTAGFYDPAIHGANIPTDAVEITAEEHAALLAGQSAGKMIDVGPDGAPVLIDPPQPSEAERRVAWRDQAYLDKGAFVTALLDADILPVAEAVQASKGDWPQTFADALSELDVDPIRAQVAWGAATGVARQTPLFLAVLEFYRRSNNLTPEQAVALGDTIFGWTD